MKYAIFASIILCALFVLWFDAAVQNPDYKPHFLAWAAYLIITAIYFAIVLIIAAGTIRMLVV